MGARGTWAKNDRISSWSYLFMGMTTAASAGALGYELKSWILTIIFTWEILLGQLM